MQLIILASGKGSRLKEKTSKKPKCLVEVNGKPIIDYMSILIEKKNTLIVTGYRANLLKKNLVVIKLFITKIIYQPIWFIAFFQFIKKFIKM